MKKLVITVMKRFLKSSVVDGLKLAKDLVALDVDDASSHLDPEKNGFWT